MMFFCCSRMMPNPDVCGADLGEDAFDLVAKLKRWCEVGLL